MPSSGARSGTRPKRPSAGGRGDVGKTTLACGHAVDVLEEVARYPSGKRVYRCSVCHQIQPKGKRC